MLLTAPQLAAVNSSDGLGNRRMEFIYIYILDSLFIDPCLQNSPQEEILPQLI
jgi:hypothetical protein